MTNDPDCPLPEHQRPDGVDDATVEALGKLSEAFEAVEHARGLLYGFHRITGGAHLMLGEAVDQLRDAGHGDLADRLAEEMLGRNVVHGRWTFQLVEEYDDTYYRVFQDLERAAREQLVSGRRHLFEAEMKERLRTRGAAHQAAVPDDSGTQGTKPGD